MGRAEELLSLIHIFIQWKDRFNLLYVQPSEVDNAYAFACKQLEFAMQCADKAKKEEKNAARRRVDRKSTRLNSSHSDRSRMPSSA